MIYIEKGQINKVPVTAAERSRITDPFYLLVLYPEFDKDKGLIFFAAPDVSGYPQRMNIFELVEGESGDEQTANGWETLEEGKAHLKLEKGQYSYKVFESENLVFTIEETTGRVLEEGRAVVGLDIDTQISGQSSEAPQVYK
jgi:hypothetical protein